MTLLLSSFGTYYDNPELSDFKLSNALTKYPPQTPLVKPVPGAVSHGKATSHW